MTGGNLLALPQWLSRYIVFIGTASLAGLTGYYVYQRFQGNPMRFHRDADGVWRPMTRKEHIEQRLAKVQEKLEGDPENKAAQIHMKVRNRGGSDEGRREESARRARTHLNAPLFSSLFAHRGRTFTPTRYMYCPLSLPSPHLQLLLKALENENKRLVEEGGGVGAVTTSGASEEDELR